MKHPFAAPAAKIDRARKHLADLEAETAAYFAKHPAAFNMQRAENAPPGPVVWFSVAFNIPGVPENLSAIVGDVIHNLRAALDLSACDAVKAAGKSTDNVHFPFSENAGELERMIVQKKFDRAGPEAVDILRQLRPYRNGNMALRAIHDLDIRDKHQALIQSARSAATPIIQMWDDDGRHNPQIIGDPTQASENKLLFAPKTGFDGKEIIPTLHELVKLIESIVETFRALANRDDANAH